VLLIGLQIQSLFSGSGGKYSVIVVWSPHMGCVISFFTLPSVLRLVSERKLSMVKEQLS
jgi:hypothetical protein